MGTLWIAADARRWATPGRSYDYSESANRARTQSALVGIAAVVVIGAYGLMVIASVRRLFRDQRARRSGRHGRSGVARGRDGAYRIASLNQAVFRNRSRYFFDLN